MNLSYPRMFVYYIKYNNKFKLRLFSYCEYCFYHLNDKEKKLIRDYYFYFTTSSKCSNCKFIRTCLVVDIELYNELNQLHDCQCINDFNKKIKSDFKDIEIKFLNEVYKELHLKKLLCIQHFK